MKLIPKGKITPKLLSPCNISVSYRFVRRNWTFSLFLFALCAVIGRWIWFYSFCAPWLDVELDFTHFVRRDWTLSLILFVLCIVIGRWVCFYSLRLRNIRYTFNTVLVIALWRALIARSEIARNLWQFIMALVMRFVRYTKISSSIKQ